MEFDGVKICASISDRSFSVANEPLSDDMDNISGGWVIEVYRKWVF